MKLTRLRYDNWKLAFMEQRTQGTMLTWANPFTSLWVSKIFNLRTDPYQRADITSNTYYGLVGQCLMTFKDYPKLRESGGSQ